TVPQLGQAWKPELVAQAQPQLVLHDGSDPQPDAGRMLAGGLVLAQQPAPAEPPTLMAQYNPGPPGPIRPGPGRGQALAQLIGDAEPIDYERPPKASRSSWS